MTAPIAAVRPPPVDDWIDEVLAEWEAAHSLSTAVDVVLAALLFLALVALVGAGLRWLWRKWR